MKADPDVERARELDAELARADRGVRVLEHLAWPAKAEERFLAAWHAGRPELPVVRLEPVDHGPAVERRGNRYPGVHALVGRALRPTGRRLRDAGLDRSRRRRVLPAHDGRAVESGFLEPARYVPPWARDLRTLAAAMTYSAFMSRVDLSRVTLENFVAFEE